MIDDRYSTGVLLLANVITVRRRPSPIPGLAVVITRSEEDRARRFIAVSRVH
jgi:hypothetical protein